MINGECSHPVCLENYADVTCKISAGQVGRILKLIKKERLTHGLLTKKVEISLLESGLRLDLTASWLLAGLKFRSTDTISISAASWYGCKKNLTKVTTGFKSSNRYYYWNEI